MKEINGKEIVAIRKAFGLSRSDLARSLNISPITVFRWEHDKNLPTGLHRDVLMAFSAAASTVTNPMTARRLGRILSLGLGSFLMRGLIEMLPPENEP